MILGFPVGGEEVAYSFVWVPVCSGVLLVALSIRVPPVKRGVPDIVVVLRSVMPSVLCVVDGSPGGTLHVRVVVVCWGTEDLSLVGVTLGVDSRVGTSLTLLLSVDLVLPISALASDDRLQGAYSNLPRSNERLA